MTFEIVGELPAIEGQDVPECRREVIAAGLAHPGVWIRYDLDGERVKAKSLRTIINRAGGGFDAGWEIRVRADEVFLRYTEPTVRVAAVGMGRRR